MNQMQTQGQMPGQMPGQSPMPGQAQGIQQVMPGMQRQGPQPASPKAMVAPLSQMPMQQLMQLMMNPRPDGPPLYAVISAISEQQKKAQAQAAMQRQGAMAQGQQAAQQPPVAQEVMAQAQQMQQPQQEPVMAAYGGEMRGYASGGAVAFGRGGNVQYFNQGADEFGLMANPEAEAMDALRVERAQKEKQLKALEETYYSLVMQNDPRAAQVKQQLDALSGRTPTPSAASPATTRQGKSGFADLDIGPSVAPSPIAPPRPAPGAGQQRPPAASASAPAAPMPGITAALSPDEQRRFEERKTALEGRRNLPPELLEGRTGIEALMQKNLAEQRAEAKTFGEEARAARDAAMAKAQRGILDDPQALLALAGSIDTRRGKGLGSLARGAAGIMGGKEAAAEAARKEYATAQQTERMLQANIRQGNMLEAQRVQAMRENEVGRVNQLDDAISQNAAERAKLERDVQNKAFEQTVEAGRLKTQQDQARAALISAGKQNELEFARSNPDEYARILKARAEASQARVSPEERRSAVMERYADNWEKLDVLQKSELAKQGITNFQQYVRMRDQMAGSGAAASQMPTGSTTLPSGFKLDKP